MSRRLAVESHTINIHGGTGGNGGPSAERGGVGGTGEGPTLSYRISAKSFTVKNIFSTRGKNRESDFSYVKLGDLKLNYEIDKETTVVRRQVGSRGLESRNAVVVTRRIYSAQVFGHQDPMTAVVFTSEPEFQKRKAELEEGARYRDPLLAQLFGFTCSAGLHALIYHDEMIPISQVQRMHEQSVLAWLYFRHEMWRSFKDAKLYWTESTREDFGDLACTTWIRLSTGKFCLDVGHGFEALGPDYLPIENGIPSLKLTENDLHGQLLHALELDQLHAFAVSNALYSSDDLPSLSSRETIPLPSVLLPTHSADPKSLQFSMSPFSNYLAPNSFHVGPWNSRLLRCETVPTGWTRFKYQDCCQAKTHYLSMQVKLNSHVGDDIEKWWISQQDYVRKHFQRAIGAENDYLPLRLITGINFDCILDPQVDGFTLRGTFMADVPTDQVYLFLCPSKVEFVDGRFIVMNPDNSQRYYWTFDPAGLDRLTHAEAEDIGLPTPTFLINVWGRSWSEREDDMIREFHTAKGFDPDSQDIAIAMQYPLINVEDIKTYVQQLKGDNFVKCREDKDAIEDEIYYSLALC